MIGLFPEKMSRSSRTLYVGNLPGDIREREVEDLFYKVNNFGSIKRIFGGTSYFSHSVALLKLD